MLRILNSGRSPGLPGYYRLPIPVFGTVAMVSNNPYWLTVAGTAPESPILTGSRNSLLIMAEIDFSVMNQNLDKGKHCYIHLKTSYPLESFYFLPCTTDEIKINLLFVFLMGWNRMYPPKIGLGA